MLKAMASQTLASWHWQTSNSNISFTTMTCVSAQTTPVFSLQSQLGMSPKGRLRKTLIITVSRNAIVNNDMGTLLKRGWLTTTGDIKFPELHHSKRPCLFFIIKGKSCRKKASECAYEHKTYPCGFKKQDQATICKWVAETPRVHFSSMVLEKTKMSLGHLHRPNVPHSPIYEDRKTGSSHTKSYLHLILYSLSN